jgi:hypothetical protein
MGQTRKEEVCPLLRSLLGRTVFAAVVLALAAPAVASAQSPSVPDFTQYGFPTVVASTTLAAGASGSLSYGALSVQIPAGAFADPVQFELLQGPVAHFQMGAPSGQTVISDFAFKVVDQTTGALVGTFQKPVDLTLMSGSVTSQSVYYNVSTTGALMPNPVPATINGMTLTHPIAAAMVGWAVTSPTASLPMVPDFTQHGFPQVVASTSLAMGAAGSVSYGGMTVQIPAGAFNCAVKFELLQGPVSGFQAPAGQNVIADFAFQVIDTATGRLIGKFQKPVTFTLQNNSVSPKSIYYNVSTSGMLTPNPVPATISGTTLTHAIPVAMVGWVVTSPATSVAGATTPNTGIPLLPFAVAGFLAIGGGVLLLRRARA